MTTTCLRGAVLPAIRVLVVDDARDLRGLVRILLDLEDDFEVVGEAASGAEAIAVAATCQPDLVLLDVAMPTMDGLSALEGLRRVAPDAKVVMFSAYDSAATESLARERGAAGFIDKPGGMVSLVERLREICPRQ